MDVCFEVDFLEISCCGGVFIRLHGFHWRSGLWLLAFVCLIKDSVNGLRLWAAFFEGIASSQCRSYVHVKIPSLLAVPDGAAFDFDRLPMAWRELRLVMAPWLSLGVA